MQKCYALPLSLLISLGCASAALAEADWPMFKHDAARTGQVAQRPAIKSPRLLWKTPVGLTGWLNSPVIAEKVVYVGSGGSGWNRADKTGKKGQPGDGVYAFDLDSGKQIWYAAAKQDVNAVVWSDKRVIATGDEGAIWALAPFSGEVLWRTPLKGAGYQLLPLDDGRVIVGDSQGNLSWIEARTGKLLTSLRLDGEIRAGVASDGRQIFAATRKGTVYAYSIDGRALWKQSLAELYPDYPPGEGVFEIYGAPVLYKDTVILGFARDTYYETPALVALAYKNGALRWRGSNGSDKEHWGNIRTSPAIYNHLLIYAEPYSNSIVAIDADKGEAEGTLAAGAPMFPQWASPAIAANTAYVPRFDGGLYAIDVSNGKPLWDFYLGIPSQAGQPLPKALARLKSAAWMPPIGDAIYASPALAADGRILLPAAGYLYCIGEK